MSELKEVLDELSKINTRLDSLENMLTKSEHQGHTGPTILPPVIELVAEIIEEGDVYAYLSSVTSKVLFPKHLDESTPAATLIRVSHTALGSCVSGLAEPVVRRPVWPYAEPTIDIMRSPVHVLSRDKEYYLLTIGQLEVPMHRAADYRVVSRNGTTMDLSNQVHVILNKPTGKVIHIVFAAD